MTTLVTPLFTSKASYGLPLFFAEQGDRLCALHRRAMKAALRLGTKTSSITTKELIKICNQQSLQEQVFRSLASLAWKCLAHNNAQSHQLTSGRIKLHSESSRSTRQLKRSFPPQLQKESTISKMVEVWEKLPSEIKDEENELSMKGRVKVFVTKLFNC